MTRVKFKLSGGSETIRHIYQAEFHPPRRKKKQRRDLVAGVYRCEPRELQCSWNSLGWGTWCFIPAGENSLRVSFPREWVLNNRDMIWNGQNINLLSRLQHEAQIWSNRQQWVFKSCNSPSCQRVFMDLQSLQISGSCTSMIKALWIFCTSKWVLG